MKYLYTHKNAYRYRVYWGMNQDLSMALPMDFNRIVLGLNWHDGCMAVVVGERLLEADDGMDRYFVVLDEAMDSRPQPLFEELVNLKDKYQAFPCFVPHEPKRLVDGLRDTDGLTHYRTSEAQAIQKWEYFLSLDITCGIYPLPAPEEGALHRDLDHWLNEQVTNPETGAPLKDSQGETVYRLQVPVDFPTAHTRTGLQTTNGPACGALWYALMGLSRSRPKRITRKVEEVWEHKPGQGGY